ncbi:MAG: hypothetical protein K5888_12690 [Lachnospiraceae bacterium]|nr:hypothetical protein [Lachnospiraceae bacterium]
MKKKRIIAVLLLLVIAAIAIIIFVNAGINRVPELEVETMNITSKDLENGKWNVRISHDKGQDLSPELTWDAVPDASCYALYMIDPDGHSWIHMVTKTTETHLDTGAVASYKGPYPPSGVHNYIVYIFALKEDISLPGRLDSFSTGINPIISSLNGKNGNIIAQGILSGTYPDR